jgi:hypothetical protein
VVMEVSPQYQYGPDALSRIYGSQNVSVSP